MCVCGVCLTLLVALFLPAVLDHMDVVATTVAGKGLDFKLRDGYSAETSGIVHFYNVMVASGL